MPVPVIDSAPAWVASPTDTPLAALSTIRRLAPLLLSETVPITVSATLSVSANAPLVVLNAPSVPIWLPPPLVARSTLPAVPVSTSSTSAALCVTAPVVCKSSVFGLAPLPVRRLVAAMVIGLLPAAPALTAPTRSVAALSV